MITKQGIEPNPEKVKAIIDMVSPRAIREVQSLNEKLATLGRFLARLVEKALPFFKTLKRCIKKRDFRWSHEAEESFQKLKLHLQSLPTLTVSIPEEKLTLYLAAIELGEHDISYKSRSTVKGQVIADFLAECPNNTSHGEPKKKITTTPKTHNQILVWTLYNDGASGNKGARVGLILTDLKGNEIMYALQFEFLTSNNESEYEALIVGFKLSIRLEVHHL
nr:hypothetical protein [Tanacetum cinerariifolium]